MSFCEVLRFGDYDDGGCPEVFGFVVLLESRDTLLGLANVEKRLFTLFGVGYKEIQSYVIHLDPSAGEVKLGARNEDGLYSTARDLGDLYSARIPVR